jgi:hypothetical protein
VEWTIPTPPMGRFKKAAADADADAEADADDDSMYVL